MGEHLNCVIVPNWVIVANCLIIANCLIVAGVEGRKGRVARGVSTTAGAT